MSQRLHVQPEQLQSGDDLALSRDQAHYLSRVLRLKAGQQLRCFDGSGREWIAQVAVLDGRSGRLELRELSRTQSRPDTTLTLAIAWLKGAAMDTVIQKATELGVDVIRILNSRRSNVSLDARRTDNKLRHWRQIAISASEQSNRLFVPEIHEPESLNSLLEAEGNGRTILLDLDAPLLTAGNRAQSMTVLVGPEGGWSDDERALTASAGVERASLGALTLRAETAPLVALAVIQHSWNWTR